MNLADFLPWVLLWFLMAFSFVSGIIFVCMTWEGRSGKPTKNTVELSGEKLRTYCGVNIPLSSVRQIVLSLSQILIRGPATNETLIRSTDYDLVKELGKQISIAIEKTRYQCQLIEIKKGEKPQKIDGVDLFFGEPDATVQPADSVLKVQRTGKSKVYTANPNLSGERLLAFAGWIGTIVFAIVMIINLRSGSLLFFFWAIPLVPCLVIALWGTFSVTERTRFKTSPGVLQINNRFVLGRKNFKLTHREIASIKQGMQRRDLGPEAYVDEVSLAVRLVGGKELKFLAGQTSVRDIKWLAHSLKEEIGLS